MADEDLRALERAWRADPTGAVRTRLLQGCERAGVEPPPGVRPTSLERALELVATHVRSPLLRSIALANTGGAFVRLGAPGRARALVEEARELAKQAHEPGLAALAYQRIACAYARLGDVENSRAHVDKALEAIAATAHEDLRSQPSSDGHHALMDLVETLALPAQTRPFEQATVVAVARAFGGAPLERRILMLARFTPPRDRVLRQARLSDLVRPLVTTLLDDPIRLQTIFIEDAVEVVGTFAPERIDGPTARRVLAHFAGAEEVGEFAIPALMRLLRAVGNPIVEVQTLVADGDMSYRAWMFRIAALRSLRDTDAELLTGSMLDDHLERARSIVDHEEGMRVLTRLLGLANGLQESAGVHHRRWDGALAHAGTLSAMPRAQLQVAVASSAARFEHGALVLEGILEAAITRTSARPTSVSAVAELELIGECLPLVRALAPATRDRLVARAVSSARRVLAASNDPYVARRYFASELLLSALSLDDNLEEDDAVATDALNAIASAQGQDRFDLVERALELARERGTATREAWVSRVLRAVDVGLTEQPMPHDGRWVATNLTRAIAEVLVGETSPSSA